MKMKETTLCYIEKDNRYLMLHRTKKSNDPNKEKWIGVGGKIYFYSDLYDDEIMYLYTATEYTGKIIECSEGDLAWIRKSDIMNLNLWEGDRLFLQKLLEDDTAPFVMKLYYQGEKLIRTETS